MSGMRNLAAAVALWSAGAAMAGAQPPAAGATLMRTDGSAIHYSVERRRPRGRQPLLIMLQGSGCDSVALNERIRWMAMRLAPGHALLTIEKYGVVPGSDGSNCTADFLRGNTLTQRVLDAVQLVAALRRQSWWSGELIIFGGSEGGAVAAMAAALIPETKAVIVWSSGIGLPVGQMIRAALPPSIQAEADRVFAEARANPAADRHWSGAGYRWWADAVDQVPARGLVQTPAPVLLIHGTGDQSAPIASARAARDLVRGSGKRNFTYREYQGFDHFMVDGRGVDHRAEVVAAAADWLRRQRR